MLPSVMDSHGRAISCLHVFESELRGFKRNKVTRATTFVGSDGGGSSDYVTATTAAILASSKSLQTQVEPARKEMTLCEPSSSNVLNAPNWGHREFQATEGD